MSRTLLKVGRLFGLVLLAGLLLAGCGRKGRPPATPSGPDARSVLVGKASWYGHPFHGRTTANGETYDMEKMTAAHKSLPFDTWVEVNNLDNGRRTVVRINDRGPFVEGRIIDLSRRAAKEIDMVRAGTARVRLRIVEPPKQSRASSTRYTVQVGAFREKGNASKLRNRLARDYDDVRVDEVKQPGRAFYRVRVGSFAEIEEARRIARKLLREKGIEQAVVLGVEGAESAFYEVPERRRTWWIRELRLEAAE